MKIDTDTRPAALGPPFTGHFRILVDTPRGLAPLHPGTKPSSQASTVRKDFVQSDLAHPTKPDSRLTAESATSLATSAANAEEPSILIKPCQTCGTTGTPVRYSSIQSRGDFVVCPPCYSAGRFPSTLHSGDFIKLDQSPYSHSSEAQWNDQETLLLLEGLEMFEEDWYKISDHVGTKTKEQCIVHFLQLPIEDPFLEATQKDLGPLQYANLPFSQTDNPVMSVIAFLASSVDTAVAARAAGESIEELEQILRKRVAATRKESNGKAAEEEKESAMEVDGAEAEVEPVKKDQPRNNIEKAAAIALGSAAAKAHLLALEEDSSLHTLVTSLVEAQVRKLELKMAHFEEIESLLEVERRGLEQEKQQLYEEKMKVARMAQEVQVLHARAKAGQAATITPAEMGSMVQGQTGNRPVPVQQASMTPAPQGSYATL